MFFVFKSRSTYLRMADNEEVNNLYSSSKFFRVIKSRRTWHLWGKMRGVYRIFSGKPQRRDHLEEPGIVGRIIL